MFSMFWMQKKIDPSLQFFIAGGAWNIGLIEKGSSIDNYTTIKDTSGTPVGYVYARGDYVMYSTWFGGGQYSTNGGTSWSDISGPSVIRNIFYDGGTFYMSAITGYYTSSDGASWNAMSGDISGYFERYCSVVSGDTIYVATANGLYYSSDGGSNWTLRDTDDGLPSNTCYHCLLIGSDIWVATTAGVCKSSNNGASWTVYTTSDGLYSDQSTRMAYDSIGDVLYCINDNGGDGRVSLTKDGGSNWSYLSQLNMTLYGNSLLKDVKCHNGIVYVTATAGDNGIGYSSDQGDNWSYVAVADLPSDGGSGTNIYSLHIRE